MKLSIAISPCPNDTFIFGPLALGFVKIPEIKLDFTYLDIEQLNQQALYSKPDIIKVSFATWLKVKDKYNLIKAGAAISEDCGPLLISKEPENISQKPINTSGKPVNIPKENKVCLIPGEHTTANLLFNLWLNEPNTSTANQKNITSRFTIYSEIMDRIAAKKEDYGVIIHESRFLIEERGLKVICDLGKWWINKTGLPIPLGCIIASKKISKQLQKTIEEKIIESISFSQENKNTIVKYIKEHAVELNDSIINKHINAFVNNQSQRLNRRSLKAIEKLEELTLKLSNDNRN
jgi:1,4-dihydroxy-6-naphthoate synthase